MRIALLFYGRIKHFDIHRSSWNKLFNNHEVDVFFSTNPEINEGHDLSLFTKWYKPVAIDNRPNIRLDVEYAHIDFSKYKQVHDYKTQANTLLQLCNKKRVADLLKGHAESAKKTYDFVILSRLDIPCDTLDFSTFEKDDTIFYIPEGRDHHGICDQFLVGTYNGMINFLQLYNSVIEYLENGCAYNPETIYKWHIEKSGYLIKRFNYALNILR